MRRIPWDVLLTLLAGLGAGLGYSWVISPHSITDAAPNALRAEFQDHYRSAIAAAYAATGNLPRARARLSLLGDADPVEALNAQAQRVRASTGSGEQLENADQLAALASVMDEDEEGAPVATPTIGVIASGDEPLTSTSQAGLSLTEIPFMETGTPEAIETPESLETQPAATESVATPRPTRTETPPPGEPFALAGQESVCDPNLPDGLLQVLVVSSSRRQLAGVEILVTWDGGQEQFFTGLKPELGNGYADYVMTAGTTYTVQLGRGSDVAQDVTPPECQTPDGQTFYGSIKLTFQQP
jgi:hypothetical protein